MLDNKLKGYGAGAEVAFNWRPYRDLDLKATYSLLHLHVRAQPGSTDIESPKTDEGGSPRNQATLLAAWQFAHDWSANGFLRYVSRIRQATSPGMMNGSLQVPEYTQLDLRLAWRPVHSIELGLTGQDLLQSRHPEYGAAHLRSELPRAVLFDAAWTWQ
jgi:iron complex outermembrane receptor protein